MKFDPNAKDDERKPFEPWPAGDYAYEVSEATEETSKNGNEMAHLAIFVYDESGNRRVVHDYITNNAVWKLRQFAESCDLTEKFKSGTLESHEMVGQTGRLSLRIENSEQYGSSNKVRQYIKAAPAKAPARAKTVHAGGGSDLDDAVPF